MKDRVPISSTMSIPIDEIDFQAMRSQGAGGQNVNKVASAVHLRFDFQNSSVLSARIKRRLMALDDQRITRGGILIKAQEYRSQARNRQAAIERLQNLIRSVLIEPKKRIPTKPSKASRKKRVDNKRKHGQLKRSRRPNFDD